MRDLVLVVAWYSSRNDCKASYLLSSIWGTIFCTNCLIYLIGNVKVLFVNYLPADNVARLYNMVQRHVLRVKRCLVYTRLRMKRGVEAASTKVGRSGRSEVSVGLRGWRLRLRGGRVSGSILGLLRNHWLVFRLGDLQNARPIQKQVRAVPVACTNVPG